METPWSYRKGKGFLYRTNAGIKLIFIFCLSIAVFIFDFYFIFIGIAVIITLSICSKIPPWELLRGSFSIIFIITAIILFQSVEVKIEVKTDEIIYGKNIPFTLNQAGLINGVLLGLRMLVSFSAGALLFSVTSMCEILRALSAAEKSLGLRRPRISLGISLMLGFIPRFFEIWEDTELAWKSRKGKSGLVKIIVLIPLIMDRLMEKAADIAEALESRACS